MRQAQRLDYGRLDAPRKTPQGGLRAPARVTRSGIFVYHRADGTPVREYRPPEEVFKADSLDTLAGAPVTLRHPTEMVDARNYRKHAIGHVGDTVRKDDDGLHVAAMITIQDAAVVEAVERGDLKEISCGYRADIDDTPGVTPDGESYQRVQRNIRYNHCAVLEKGRAGTAALRLDADDNVIDADDNGTETPMTKERIDGVEYDVGSPAHTAAVARRDEADKARAKQLADLTADRDKAQARADAADTKVKALESEFAKATDASRIDGLVAERVTLTDRARKILGGDARFDGKDNAAVVAEAVAKAYPDIKLDGKSADYVRALFDAVRIDADGIGNLRTVATLAPQGRTDAAPVVRTGEQARREMLERNRNAWKRDDATANAK